MHSNIRYEIWSRPYKSWWKRNRRMAFIFAIVIGAFVLGMWYAKVFAMQQSQYADKVHVCISAARQFNQYNAAIQIDPQKCLTNPYVIR